MNGNGSWSDIGPKDNEVTPDPCPPLIIDEILDKLGLARKKVLRAAEERKEAESRLDKTKDKVKLAAALAANSAGWWKLFSNQVGTTKRNVTKMAARKAAWRRWVRELIARQREEIAVVRETVKRRRHYPNEERKLFFIKLGTVITHIEAQQRGDPIPGFPSDSTSEPTPGPYPESTPEPAPTPTTEPVFHSTPETDYDIYTRYTRIWATFRNHDRKNQLHFCELPWPVIGVVKGPEDLTCQNVERFLASKARLQKCANWESLRKSVHKELTIWHPDKSSPVFDREVHPEDLEMVKEAVLEVTKHLNHCLEICCTRIEDNIHFPLLAQS